MNRFKLTIGTEQKKIQNVTYKEENNDKKAIIDAIAIGSKLLVECTKLHPLAKASINLGINFFADCLKNQPLSDIEQIRIAAKCFDVDKVVLVPFGSLRGKDIVVIRAYGHKAEEFINHLGLHLIPEKEKNDFINGILEIEKSFGVVIYLKNN